MDLKILLGVGALFLYARSKKEAAPAAQTEQGKRAADSSTKPLSEDDIENVPYVDEAAMSVEPIMKDREYVSNKVRTAIEKNGVLLKEKLKQAAAYRQKQEERIGLGSYRHGKMLERSLKREDDLLSAALMQTHQPFQRSSTVRNPLLGFVPGEAMGKVDADFSIYDAVPAQDFNSIRNVKDVAGQDFPLVDDDSEKGDFAGVLLSERGSPDFSTMIVNEAKTDFGAMPRDRLRRR